MVEMRHKQHEGRKTFDRKSVYYGDISGVCSGIAPKDAATIAQAHSVPYIYGSGILHNHHDLLWRELLLGWNAQLCLMHKQISYINVPLI